MKLPLLKILLTALIFVPLMIWLGFVNLTLMFYVGLTCATLPFAVWFLERQTKRRVPGWLSFLIGVGVIFPCFFLVSLLTGCQLFGKNAAPPTAFDQKAFNIITNTVYDVKTVTNVIPLYQTNVQLEVMTLTNEQKQIVQVFATNYIPVLTYSNVVHDVTNAHEVYDYTHPSQTSQTVASVAGTLSNMGLPGIGSLVSMALIGGLGIYGKLRGNKVAGALAQGIETAREVMKTTPQGQELDAKYQAWLVSHQAAAGVISAVTDIVNKQINTPMGEAVATSAAKQITAGITTPPKAA